ncbi:MAG: GntR family transcriptional regulator [Bacteroidota bacterium]
MIEVLQIDKFSDVPKYRQLEMAVAEGVSNGVLVKNTKLPSINEVVARYDLSRDTVVKAYNILRERGIISSTQGKGFYITGAYNLSKRKVFVLFNELNAYKEVLHKSLIRSLGMSVEVDTFFHNHNLDIFEYLIDKSLGNYTHYVIMPTFNTSKESVLKAIQRIPSKKLFLIDRNLRETQGASIYQDFRNDALQGLLKLGAATEKYREICVLYQDTYLHPFASLAGINDFCIQKKMPFEVKTNIEQIEKSCLYVCLKDSDLIKLVKLGNQQGFIPGQDYGLLSYNESPMKEIIHQGITVISTDFGAMGAKTAEMILEDYQAQIANPIKVIKRSSV